MTSKKTTSAVSILALFDIIKDHGMPVEELEKRTGINRSKMESPDTRITMTQFLKLWETAVELTNNPALGLHLRKNYGTDLMHFVVTLALMSETLLEALQHWMRYAKLICETDHIELREEGNYCIISYINTSPEHENRWIPEHHMALACEYTEKFSDQRNFMIEARFSHPDPGYADEYRKLFQCPILFDQEENAAVIKKEVLHGKITSRDPYLQSILKKHADESMKIFSKKEQFKNAVQKLIVRDLPKGMVDSRSISKSLNMDRSTLHRHLKKEGTSFKFLLTETRKSLAGQYLIQNRSISQIAYLLGFSDPSTFQRAFKRWFDKSPGEFRKENQP